MRHLICCGLAIVAIVAVARPADAALRDNWLSRLMEKRLNERFRSEDRRIDRIVADIKAEPKGKEFAAKEGLRDAVVKGVEAARERRKKLKELPIGPTPAQAGAVAICRALELEYPEDPPPEGDK
jgi:hypothetical protein